MSRIIAYKNKQGKYNITIIGDDVKQNILLSSNQGYERKAGVFGVMSAVYAILKSTPVDFMTRAEYQAFLRQRRRGK